MLIEKRRTHNKHHSAEFKIQKSTHTRNAHKSLTSHRSFYRFRRRWHFFSRSPFLRHSAECARAPFIRYTHSIRTENGFTHRRGTFLSRRQIKSPMPSALRWGWRIASPRCLNNSAHSPRKDSDCERWTCEDLPILLSLFVKWMCLICFFIYFRMCF